MCGIAGFCDVQKNYLSQRQRWDSVIEEMCQILRHRGGDQEGGYLREHTGLSHSRLSIRDVEGGIQPMVRRREGHEYAIVYNGELYNTEELKGLLPGCTYSTATDTVRPY